MTHVNEFNESDHHHRTEAMLLSSASTGRGPGALVDLVGSLKSVLQAPEKNSKWILDGVVVLVYH